MTVTDPASEERLQADLRGAGLRVTAPRLSVLRVVAEQPHAGTDEIAGAVRERLGSVSTQAVYGVLHALTDAGLLRRVDTGARAAARYELQSHDNHHHMLCRECGRLEDVPCAVGNAPCLIPEHNHGFEIEVAEVLFRGVCSQCRATAS
ncbi:Fur family transcriptional regulator [uncultured Agrococcus sp.]|uniref:Fur family transcriptional regulator n=1 Tax=uncultured Agrococcus sp. TaxID=382258 RepID=UPI0025E5A998|nr:Fur family transcriptional regulator [uncultured Agrococcus sp.]